MAQQTATAKYVSGGVNRGNIYLLEAIVPVALAASDTFLITTPDGVDQCLPLVAQAYAVDGSVTTQQDTQPLTWPTGGVPNPLLITAFDKTLRTVKLTNPSTGASIPVGSRVLVFCYGDV